MNAELRKRLEEAREQGYKEAVKVAKEWLERHIGDFHPKMDNLYLVNDSDEIYYDGDELLTDFEADMNKLKEKKK